MAERKYDLLLVETGKNQVQTQPWYKERLQTKYIKGVSKQDKKLLNAKDWFFLKDGLDDFRDGLPPPVDDDIFIRQERGLAPNITSNGSQKPAPVKTSAVNNRFTKEEVCFQSTFPLQQQRRDNIEEIEFGLTQHPLALYPHLEESLPPDMFEDVVDIIDPAMNIIEEESLADSQEEQTVEQGVEAALSSKEEEEMDQQEEPMKNPYKWLPTKEEKEAKEKKKMLDPRTTSPSEDEHIKKVTRDFTDWVASLGGDTNNIEDSTVTSLFASGYETKPALSVPIHVVELTSVPPELRGNVQMPSQEQKKDDEDGNKDELQRSEVTEPTWVKFRYGAWYLPRKHWKKMDAKEPLQDPIKLKDTKHMDAKKRSTTLDKELAPMHGTHAFMDFMDRKGTRKPKFLNNIEEIQRKTEAEERARQEAEMLKKSGRKLSQNKTE